MFRKFLAAASFALLPAAASAQNGIEVTLGAGVGVGPSYFGADSYGAGPKSSISLEYLRFGKLTLGSPVPGQERPGFSFGGSFRRIGARSAADHPELTGLEDIEKALELGVRAAYGGDGYRAFGALRYGVIGHESLVGEVGADRVGRASRELTLSAGPRAYFGSDSFASTYFGVTPAEAAASGLPAFAAEGGLLSAGLEFGAQYRFGDKWGLKGSIGYTRWLGDAGDSPITGLGSRGQVRASLVLTRRVRIGF
jgi:outer membrane protein